MPSIEVTDEVLKRLREPFPLADERTGVTGVGFKPQSVTKDGTRAMAVPYIDARDVMDRLDEVVGPGNWKSEFLPIGNDAIMCTLSIRTADGWVSKSDVGGESDQPDKSDKVKAAFSEALKRAAVHWGIGRLYYSIPTMWLSYDNHKKQFTEQPRMPAWAMPKGQAQARPQQQAQPQQQTVQQAPQQQPQQPQPQTQASPTASGVSGVELHRRLREKDAKLAAAGRSKVGELLTHLAQAGTKAGYGDDISKWPDAAFDFAVAAVKAFEANHPTTDTEFPFGNNAPAEPAPVAQRHPPVNPDLLRDDFLKSADLIESMAELASWKGAVAAQGKPPEGNGNLPETHLVRLRSKYDQVLAKLRAGQKAAQPVVQQNQAPQRPAVDAPFGPGDVG